MVLVNAEPLANVFVGVPLLAELPDLNDLIGGQTMEVIPLTVLHMQFMGGILDIFLMRPKA